MLQTAAWWATELHLDSSLAEAMRSAGFDTSFGSDETIQLIGEQDIFQFLPPVKFDRLGTRLTTLLMPSQISEIAHESADWAESFPRRYAFYFPMSRLGPFGVERLEIADGVALVDPEPGRTYDGLTVRPGAGAGVPRKDAEHEHSKHELIGGTRYLRVESSGAYQYGERDTAAVDAFSKFKRWAILGEAYGLLSLRSISLGGGDEVVRVSCVSYKQQVENLEITSIGRILKDMTWSEHARAWPIAHILAVQSAALKREIERMERGLGRAALEAANDPIIPPEGEDLSRIIAERFAPVSRILNSAGSTGAIEVCAASEWLFDARCEANETVRFMKVSIGFESLLGSDEKKGVTQRMEDRVSFLLGVGRAGREEVREKFEKFYDARSDIVHGRAARISQEQEQILKWAQNQLMIAITREAQAIHLAEK